MMRMKLAGLALVGLTALAPAAAEAGVISYNAATIGPSLTELGTVGTPLQWAFQQFNPALGTLLSVALDIDVEMETSLTASNDPLAGSNAVGDVSTRLRIFVQDPGLNLFAGGSGGSTLQRTWGEFAYNLAPGASVNSGSLTTTANSNNLYTSAPVLAEFTGLVDMVLNVYTSTATVNTNSGGNFTASQSTFATLNGTVTYTYEDAPDPAPIPEPTSMFLLGSGALALVRMRRKQRSQ